MTNVRTGSHERLGRFASRLTEPSFSDTQLIDRFLASRDEESFAALVRRHGPLVLAVCRRVASDHHLADDAFQAVFLVLARKAETINPREAVRGWLHGVATHIALRARTMIDRRRKKEKLTSVIPEPYRSPTPFADSDTLQILDEEIAALPDHFRSAVVLCELDGVRRKEAACQLGIPEGTLSSRLAKGRKILARRLRERGVTAPLAVLATLSGSAANASISSKRVSCTAHVATGSLSPSANAANLYREVLSSMLLHKIRFLPVLVIGLIIAATSMGFDASDPPNAAPLVPQSRTNGNPDALPNTVQVPKATPRPNVLMLWAEGSPIFIKPDGTIKDRPERNDWLPEGKPWHLFYFGWSSPDGKQILFSETNEFDGGSVFKMEFRLSLRAIGKSEKAKEIVKGVHGAYAFWSRDGQRIFGSGYDAEKMDKFDSKDEGPYFMENWVFDRKSGKKSTVEVPSTCAIRDESPDGKCFLTNELSNEKRADGRRHYCTRAFITTPGTKPEHKRLAPELGEFSGFSFSPDGTKVLALRPDPGKFEGGYEVLTVDLKTGKTVLLNKIPEEQAVWSPCWSPDGTKIAFIWHEYAAAPPGGVPVNPRLPVPAQPPGAPPAPVFVGSHVSIVDVDGKNGKRIHSEPGVRITVVDWR